MMKITGLSHLFKWENLHNWWLTKYFFCPTVWLNCIYLYLNVYCQCLMLTVCTKALRVTQFQLSVCMYCTCGRIDNKARLDLT